MITPDLLAHFNSLEYSQVIEPIDGIGFDLTRLLLENIGEKLVNCEKDLFLKIIRNKLRNDKNNIFYVNISKENADYQGIFERAVMESKSTILCNPKGREYLVRSCQKEYDYEPKCNRFYQNPVYFDSTIEELFLLFPDSIGYILPYYNPYISLSLNQEIYQRNKTFTVSYCFRLMMNLDKIKCFLESKQYYGIPFNRYTAATYYNLLERI